MRFRTFAIAVLLIMASALFLTGRPFLTPSLALTDKPDLIVVFSGDIQGYLEECG
jgi:hypothetical protein